MSKVKAPEAEAPESEAPAFSKKVLFCGYCGERLPDLGDGWNGGCPQCRRRFGERRQSRRPPPPPLEWRAEGLRQTVVHGPVGSSFRDPVLAALLSAVIPGSGQVYNLQPFKGLFIFLTCWLVIPYFLGIFDAYLTAERTNRSWQTVTVRRI